MARGIERRKIFRDDHDREDFIARLAGLAEKEAWHVYAWCLMPNHFHLLVRTGKQPLSHNMRALMSGYAIGAV
jgi:putative transposase